MADSKLKYLALYEILKNESSKEKPLSTTEICEKLQTRNVVKNRRNIQRDMEGLAALGYAVKKTKIGHENAFYVECDELTEGEPRIILDALQAATFITPERTEAIKTKILAKIPNNEATDKIIFNTKKADSDLSIGNISVISKAIRNNHCISFKVFDLDENFNIDYHKDGQSRCEEPVALVYNNDKCYLLTMNYPESGKTGDFIHYRVDYIDNVVETETTVSDDAVEARNHVSEALDNVISMFDGKPETVVLSFNNKKIIRYLAENFGKTDTKIIKLQENEYIASINARISPTFYGFLFQFKEKLSIISPEWVKNEFGG